MPDVLPTINNEPAQGIQALLDTVYLWNQDVANELIEQINELLEELGDFSDAGCIKPYSELTAPVRQYLPCYNGDNVYVAAADIETLPEQFNPSQWILIATKAPVLQAGAGIDINGNEISVEQQVLSDAAAGGTAVQPEDLGTAAYASTSDFATAAQGGKADTAVQPGDLGTAAYAATTDFATAAQGALADTAVQPSDLAAVATSGSYTDLSNKPAIDGVTLTSQTTKADIGLAGVYKYKGSVATYADLANVQNPDVGDVYNVEDTGDNYAWSGTEWDQLGGTFVPPVTSVNSKTGAVVLSAEDVGAIPQYSTMPTADSTNAGEIVQFTGATDANYTHGYIYECVGTQTQASAVGTQTAGTGLTNIQVDVAAWEEGTGMTEDGSLTMHYFGDGWNLSPNAVGVTFDGTPVADDEITVVYTAGTTSCSWERVDVQPAPEALPDQTGNAGKFLTTDGTTPSWAGAVPQYTVMPTASERNLGNIVQYVGATTEDYINGYFYKCATNENGVGSGEIDVNYWFPDPFTPPVTGSVDIDVLSQYLEQNNLDPISDGRIEITFQPNANIITFGYNIDTSGVYTNIPWNTVTTQAAEDIFANMGFDFDFSGVPTNMDTSTGGQMPSATVYFWKSQPVMDSIGVYKDDFELPEATAENVGTAYLVTPYDSETMTPYSPAMYMSVPYILNYIDGEAEVAGYGLTPETQPTDVMIDWATLESYLNSQETGFDWTNDTINILLDGENFLEVLYNADFSASAGVQTDGTVANIQQELENIGITVDLTGYTQFQFLFLRLPTEKGYENRQVPAFVPSSGIEEADYVLKADGNGWTYWAAEAGGLPDQTGQSGKFLTTDGSSASWESALRNTSTGGASVTIEGTPTSEYSGTNVGKLSRAEGAGTTAYGWFAEARADGATAVGSGATVRNSGGIALGRSAESTDGGFVIALWDSQKHQYVICDSGGNIPSDRLKNTINKYSIMPTAASTNEGWIVQFTGTTNGTYTHGYLYECVSDGQNPATYSWEQIDVQPAGATGINWATTVDLPANSGLYDACPYYVISGGLPDGTYEFSWQMRCYGIDSNSALGMVTYKVIMSVWTVGGTTKYARGYLAPVIDGEWFPGSRNIPEGNSFYSIFRLDANGNWYLFIEGSYIWCTDIYNNNASLAVPDCFKLSTIKNVSTGDEYTATGYLYDPNNPPAWDEGFVEGQIEMKPLALVPSQTWNQNASWFGATNNTNYIAVSGCNLMPATYGYPGGNFEELNIIVNSGADIFDGTIHCKDYYAVAEIRKATGVFAGATLGVCRGEPTLYIPNNAGDSCLGFVSVSGCKSDVDLTHLSLNSSTAEPMFRQFPTLNIGAPVTSQTYGTILQYDGVTDSNYTNGYFYKASGTPVTTTYGGSLQVLSPSGASITMDWAELVDAAYNTIGWMTRDQIVSNIRQAIGQANTYYVDTGELYIEGFVSIDTTTYTNVCAVTGYGAETRVEFMITDFNSPYTEIQNGSWARVDVQPGSSLPSQTGQSGKFLTTDGTDASWATVDALPSQAGNAGKMLVTNGTTASWGTPTTVTFRTWGVNE